MEQVKLEVKEKYLPQDANLIRTERKVHIGPGGQRNNSKLMIIFSISTCDNLRIYLLLFLPPPSTWICTSALRGLNWPLHAKASRLCHKRGSLAYVCLPKSRKKAIERLSLVFSLTTMKHQTKPLHYKPFRSVCCCSYERMTHSDCTTLNSYSVARQSNLTLFMSKQHNVVFFK